MSTTTIKDLLAALNLNHVRFFKDAKPRYTTEKEAFYSITDVASFIDIELHNRAMLQA